MAPRKTNRRIRPARISSGGLRSRSSLFATGPAFAELRRGNGRDGCFDTRDVYYGVAAYATRSNALSSTRWQENAALPPDICAFGESDRYRLRRSRSTLKGGTVAAATPQRVGKPLAAKCAASAVRLISIAGAETSTTPELRAGRLRPSRAQERRCHLPEYYRSGSEDRRHWTGHR